MSLYKIHRECICKSLQLLVSRERNWAALMLLTQELGRGAGISPYWAGRKHIFKFLSIIQDSSGML